MHPDKPLEALIITRPEPDGTSFARLVAPTGIRTLINPVIEIRWRNLSLGLDDVTALAFTSTNGVRAFEHQGTRWPDGARHIPVFAVGRTTAQAARDAGFRQVIEARGDVVSLADHIRAHLDTPIDTSKDTGCGNRRAQAGQTVLHVAGSHRKGDLGDLLSNSSVTVRRAVLYEAIGIDYLTPESAALVGGKSRSTGVSFFSPRTVRLFANQIARAGLSHELMALRAYCLSAAVGEAALGIGIPRHRISIAPEPDAHALRNLLRP